MNTRTLASLLAGAALATGIASARPDDKIIERDRTLLPELIKMVGDGNAGATTKLRLAFLLRDTGAEAEANKLFAELTAEIPDLNSLLNPSAMPEIERMVRESNYMDTTGPDVIVGDINGLGNFTSGGNVGGVMSFSTGTTSCNIGSIPLAWIDNSPNHPVIAQNFYRIKNGRLEQIGMGWLKHGFCALQNTVCGSCTPYGNCCCDHLGLGCSDPYDASLNGTQSRLGPRNEVNPSTGVYPWPHYNGSGGSTTIWKRLQVRAIDMDPALNVGATYFGEAQYVTLDDATAGNKHNNASYRRFTHTFSGSGAAGTVSSMSFNGSTQRMRPATQAWQDIDTAALPGMSIPVTLVNVDVPSDGRVIVAYKVTDLGGGMWHYEFALENLNSDRAVGSFSIPVGGASISNIGFHDVDYHDGDGVVNGTTQDGTDWAAVNSGGNLTWTYTPVILQPSGRDNGNALKFATTYNFRFDANGGPSAAMATLGLFKPGADATVTAAVQGPACVLAGDINGDGMVGFDDLNLVLANFGTLYNFEDLNILLSNFGRHC